MRISVDRDDPGHAVLKRLRERGNKVLVYLDGHLVRRCITADEDEEFVLVYAEDENGNVRVNEDHTGTVQEKRYGSVKIVAEL